MWEYINTVRQSRIQRQLRLRKPDRKFVINQWGALASKRTTRKSKAGPSPGGAEWTWAPGPGRARAWSQVSSFSAEWPWASHLSSRRLGFLICDLSTDMNVCLTASVWSLSMSFVPNAEGVLRNHEVLLNCERSWGQGGRGEWGGEEVRRRCGEVHHDLKGTPGGDWESAAGRSPIIRTWQSQSQALSQGHMLQVAWLQAGSLTSNFQGHGGS